MEQARLTGWQTFLLVLSYTLGTASIIYPGRLIASGSQDAWMIPLFAGIYGMVVVALWIYLYSLHNGLNIIQINMKVFGKIIGGFFALVYICYFIQLSSWITRNLGDFMHITLMPETPISMFHIMFLTIVCYASFKGIVTIGRVNEIMTPLIFLLFWATYLVMLGEWNWERFIPSFRLDVIKTMKETSSFLAFPFMETICFTMIFPFIKSKLKTSLISGIGVAALLFSLIVFLMIGLIGVTRASHLTYPLFTLFQELRLYSFIEHVEAIVSIAWLFTVFVKLSISYYCAVLGICTIFNIQNRAIIAIPLIWVVAGIALSNHSSLIDVLDWDKKYMFIYTLLYAVIIPLLLLTVTGIKGYKERKVNS
ncbi:spore germination protein KB [Paenibacillus sp. V4I9]|uniref:GerAB/ArcD/ProY family transporter n=1 Tax=Paenibacillus sp. V4I9 TaxID=3042308 RepID=UPI0027847975|nr:endospore germination permease [Paenibacillus sp. V4I9]MDQ0889808.1 spore germination protein KB [Paenibacillus sp. V4I9]